ncbi:ectoine/hydroxyectoine ABC transporter substrate-binding protein EhuB [Gandjariella thermophila]|uniref:Ectoine/hydroxyectoine ABC transporter substrate-binding protein EhuB n=1 Tax=Gandjariella thermophila TaxID=1931992 RepID=A0A4D4JGN2_9PSEU|nr:ectoine/hydroxyectoine ABC transporter substrate-binding protein EhuB [Gandjariella thermophila]GDY33566.1 ectoine/hydroxyectoine ABC transporter substrate-binding protein EhuB [Gandjariella thermophila]
MANSAWTRRDFFKRSIAAGAVVLGGPTLLEACSRTSQSGGGSVLDNAKKSGTIKIGIANEQPYGFTDKSGKVTGEAPEVARAVFKSLGVNDVQATTVDFNQLIPALNARQYDMVAAGMNITPARCGNAAFSIPDYHALTAFLVPKGNPKGVASFDDVKGKGLKLAVLSGAVEKDYATKSGVPDGQVQSFDTQNALLQAVTSGRADAAALTDISLHTLVAQNPGAGVEVTKGFDPVIDGKKVLSAGGFVFRKDEDDVRNAFNDQLKKLHDSGQWLQIVQPFGFSQDNLPAPELTTDKLCSSS